MTVGLWRGSWSPDWRTLLNTALSKYMQRLKTHVCGMLGRRYSTNAELPRAPRGQTAPEQPALMAGPLVWLSGDFYHGYPQ